MDTLLLILIILAILLTAALFVPVRVILRLSSRNSALKIMFGPLPLINSFDRPKKKKAPEKKAPEKEKKSRSEQLESALDKIIDFSPRKFWDSLVEASSLFPALSRAMGRFVLRILKKTEFSDFSGHLGGGLGDPALTGVAVGWVHTLVGAIPVIKERISFAPDYLADKPLIELSGQARILPIHTVLAGVALVWDAPLGRLIKFWRNSRSGPKKSSKK